MRRVGWIFACCSLMLFGVEETEISKYLQKEINPQNPFIRYKKIGNMLGIPLPVIKKNIPKYYKQSFFGEKEEVKNLINKENKWDPFSLSNSVFNSALKEVSPIFSQRLDSLIETYIPKADFKINLDSYVTQESQNIGGDVNLSFPILEYQNSSVFLIGGFMRDSQTLQWGEKYGIEHKIKNIGLPNLVLMQSVIQNHNVVNERTWNYGLEYSPFRNILLYFQRENNKIDQDNTKTGIQYRILF